MTRMPLHPFLFGLFPLAYLFSVNVNYTNGWEVPRAALVVLGVAGVLWGAASAALRHAHKGAIFATLALLALFTYGPVLDALRPIGMGRHVIVAPIEMLLLAGAFALLWRTRRPLKAATHGLNVVALCVLAVSLTTAAMNYDWSADAGSSVVAPAVAAAPADALPNIYYIIPDAYGREDILRARYDLDIGPFVAALRERGFYVADEATSNYWMTLYSLSSTMTMDYHRDLADRLVKGDRASTIRAKRHLRASVAEGPVIRQLRERGYTIVSFSSGFSVSETVDPDVYIAPPTGLSEFEQGVIDMTPLRWVLLRFSRVSPYALHRARVDYEFDHVAKAAQTPGPKFVLMHLAAPHPPFVFGPDGEDVSPYDRPFSYQHGQGALPFGETNHGFIRGYRDQLTYVNKRLLEAIDTILDIEERTPVILLQGDHGPMANRGPDNEPYFAGERFPILSAYLLPPPGDPGALYPSITPVNSFRVIFNQYFGTDYPLLEDRNIANSGGIGIQDYTEIARREIAEIVGVE